MTDVAVVAVAVVVAAVEPERTAVGVERVGLRTAVEYLIVNWGVGLVAVAGAKPTKMP